MASTAIPVFPQPPITSLPLASATTTTPGLPPPSPSPSPSQAQAHLYSPTKPPRTQPNAHPYAIKTTSTALLSRSTSSSTNTQSTAHHYVPSSPSPSPSMSPSPSPTSPTHSSSMNIDSRDREYQPRATRHRYSRSLTSDMPMPLPPPPGAAAASSTAYAIAPSHSTPGISNPYAYTYAQSQTAKGHNSSHRRDSVSGGSGAENNDEDDTPRRKNRSNHHQRAETMPLPLPSLPLNHTGSSSSSLAELPEDPKTWTSEQLAVYVGSDGNANSGLMVKFVREKKLSGRAFLRLAETDLDSLPHATRASLLALSRGLRQKLVRAKIFGANPNGGSHQDKDNDNTNISPHPNNNDRDDVPAPIGSLTRQHAVRPRRRSRVDSLSGASDSSSASSLANDTGTGDGDTPRSNTNARRRVKERVDALEEKIGMMEEEGTASSSSSSASVSGNGNGEDGGANGSLVGGAGAGKIQTKKSRMPQRGAVASLFEQGPAADSSGAAIDKHPQHGHLHSGQGNSNHKSINNPGGAGDAYVDDKDSTITHVARRNVNGKEPRMLPFPPVFPSGQHPQHQHHQHDSVPVGVHQKLQFHAMSSPGPGAADSPALPDEYYGYEFGLRRAFGSAPGLGHGHAPRSSATANASAIDNHGEGDEHDPHAGVFVVRHRPSSPRIVSGSGPVAGAGAGSGVSGAVGSHNTGGETARKASPRLLPYPPVVGRAVLHHPRPRRLVGVAMEMGNETGATTTSDTGNEVWETALEEFGEGGIGGREKEEDEELSVEELLLREADVASPEKKKVKTISGVDAWEMEVGDTVKRVGDVSWREKEKEKKVEGQGGGEILRLFENATLADGAGAGVSAQMEQTHTHVDEMEMEMAKREDAVRVREDDVTAREGVVQAKEADLKALEEGLKTVELGVLLKEEDLHAQKESLCAQEESLRAQEEGLRAKEEDVLGKEESLDARLREVEERERLLGLREEDVGRREENVLQREEGVGKKEEEIWEKEKEKEIRGKEKDKEKQEMEDHSIQTLPLTPPSTVDQAVATLNTANVDAGSQTQDPEIETLGVTGAKGKQQPSPYLISAWTIKRDWFLGRFRGIFAGARLSVVGVGGSASAGGALVLMSLGVCAVVLRVLARKVLGGAAAHAAAGGGRR